MKVQPLFILLALFSLWISINGCSNSKTQPTETVPISVSSINPNQFVSVSADRMNILYIGLINPISIITDGIPSEDLEVTMAGGSLEPTGAYKYLAKVNKPGTVTITVSTKKLKPVDFKFRVKRLANPTAKLSRSSGGVMSLGEFRAQGGISVPFVNLDINANCKVDGFDVGRIPKGKTLIEASNRGARYKGEVAQLIAQASAGDVYFFHKIRVRYPGDVAAREINSMVFKIR